MAGLCLVAGTHDAGFGAFSLRLMEENNAVINLEKFAYFFVFVSKSFQAIFEN